MFSTGLDADHVNLSNSLFFYFLIISFLRRSDDHNPEELKRVEDHSPRQLGFFSNSSPVSFLLIEVFGDRDSENHSYIQLCFQPLLFPRHRNIFRSARLIRPLSFR